MQSEESIPGAGGGAAMELVLQNIKKCYGKTEALKGVSMTLTHGIYGLLGPNGAGKSTLMNILTGNLKQTEGQILLNGSALHAVDRQLRGKIGYCPQQEAFYPGFTAEQFLFYTASLQGMEKQWATERINWALDVLSLSAVRRKAIRGFSGGMKQRLLLAQAIIHDPDILILDEPTAGLDPRQRIAVRNLISEIALHKIVLISTHVVQDIEHIAKELILLEKGQILYQGNPMDLLASLEGQVWEVMADEGNLEQVCRSGVVCGMSKVEGQICVRLLCNEHPFDNMRSVRPALEDVYLYFFGDEESK